MSRAWRWTFLATLLVAATMTAMVILHAPGVNGPDYWQWLWRDLSALPALRWYPAMLLAALPMIGAWLLPDRTRWSRIVAIVLIMTSVVAMKLAAMLVLTKPASFDAMAMIVRSRLATSYYIDATLMADAGDVLASYPAILESGGLHLHTLSKPPGPVMYFLAFVRAMGDSRQTAVASAIGLAILASLAVPATFWLARRWLDHRASLIAAMLLGVCPGFVVIFPTMDAVYAAIACAMVGTWHVALAKRDLWWAVAFGLALSLACFASYSMLTLGALLAAWTIAHPLTTADDRRTALARVARVAFVSLATVVVVYSALKLATRFDPVATFRAAWENQHALLAEHGHARPWRRTVVWDLLDFLLSFGWAMLVPIAFGVRRAWADRSGAADRATRWFVLLCVLQPIVVALTGLLQTETARVWNFLLPLAVLPAAIELSRWPKWARVTAMGAMLIVMLAVGHNMIFLQP